MNKKNLAIILFLVTFAIIFSGCVEMPNVSRYCSDGTREGTCSDTKPLFCENGKIVQNLVLCGCEKDYRLVNGKCVSLLDCKDGIKNLSCAEKKPFQCVNASFVEKASVCGCPVTQEPNGDSCVEAKANSETREFEYVLRGESGKIQFAVYADLRNLLAGLPRTYVCKPDCPAESELQLVFLDHEDQKVQLQKLVEIIKSRATNNDDRARIAISFVQNIPYDLNALVDKNLNNRYPYEVLFDNKGVCGEKSRLLVFLLRELGFGTAILDYAGKNHQAAGIKCPEKYSLNNSGYCFVETTSAAIITDDKEEYISAGKLDTVPETIVISDGASLDSVYGEYFDAIEYQRLEALAENNNNILEKPDFDKWQALIEKYGIEPSASK